MGAYRVGAVVYHERVLRIWAAFAEWFQQRGFPIDPVPFETYDAQIQALLDGRLDVAWNTNLAYVQVLDATNGACGAVAMRDTDIGWRSLLVVRTDSSAQTLADLRGKRVGFGDRDSPQAHLVPVHEMRADGLDPAVDLVASRLDRDVGKHGDTGAAELAQLARLRAGELDGAVCSNLVFNAIAQLGNDEDLRVVWRSPPFNHCNFTVLDEAADAHAEFARLLMSMDAADPKLCEPMELEGVNRWVPFDPTGYASIIAAVRGGPVIVG